MKSTPLAERLRPQTLDDFIGQEHLIGKNGALYKILKNNLIPSLIFWGPPGVGKTTLAEKVVFSRRSCSLIYFRSSK